MKKEDVEKAIKSALSKLKDNEQKIIANNTSERAITHKLAEYLQLEFPLYNVDCEYNRNYEEGKDKPKYVRIISEEVKGKLNQILNQEEHNAENILSFCKQVTSYPDIIVHERLTNSNNLLAIEVKKDNNNTDWEIDHQKLRGLTMKKEYGGYGYHFGLHITIFIQDDWREPTLKWYENGDIPESIIEKKS